MIKVHKEMRGLDRYREQPKEYKYHDPYDISTTVDVQTGYNNETTMQ